MKAMKVTAIGFVVVFVYALLAKIAFSEGVTPLMKASRSGDIATVQRLLSEGADVDKTSCYKWTALMFAANEGHEEIVRTLLHNGANPNILSKPVPASFETTGDYPPTTALAEAIKEKHIPIAYALIKHGTTIDPASIALAGRIGNIELLENLHEHDVDFNQETPYGYAITALCEASTGRLETVKWLISKGADPNFICHRRTPLCSAFETGYGQTIEEERIKIIEYLLANGADPNQYCDRDQYSSPLKQVLWLGDLKLLEYILKQGADPNLPLKYGNTVLFESNNLQETKILLAHGADKFHKNDTGKTAAEDHAVTLEFLISRRKENPISEDSIEKKRAVIKLLQ